MNEKKLSVRLHGEQVGILEQTSTGKMYFTYDTSTAKALSVSLPVREEPYNTKQCEAFFSGLLPENYNARKAIGLKYGINSSNTFALLKAIGYDCAGAISFHPVSDPIKSQRAFPLEGKFVGEDILYEHIKALPEKPLFLGFEELRLSLAGAQEKAAVCIIDNEIALPQHGCPTTHILKPASARHEGIVENEYFCMKLAAKIGLPVPNVEVRQIKDITYLLIERYDRCIQKNQVERIHQEDFCQALGILSTRKYQNEGGPGFKDCFDLLKLTSQPAVERNKLAAVMIYNFLIGNMDAHGKNFSLLYTNELELKLAPFYDIVCTRIYSSLTSKMAMKIDSKYEANHVLARHWEQLSKNINYSYPALKRLIQQQGELILEEINKNKEYYTNSLKNIFSIEKIFSFLTHNIINTFKQFK